MGSGVLSIQDGRLVTITLLLFALIGFRRGASRELFSLIGILLGLFLATTLRPPIQGLINLLHKMAWFVLAGGMGGPDPVAVWGSVSQQPSLIGTQRDEQWLSLVLFVLVVAGSYALGQVAVGRPKGILLRLLGLPAGAINGFLISFFLFPIMFSRQSLVINLGSGDIMKSLLTSRNEALLVFFLVVVLIGLGLVSSQGQRRKG